MNVVSAFFQYILDLGAAIFLPIIFIFIGLLVRMKPSRAVSAGITFGVAFTGIKMVTNFLTSNVGAAAQAFVNSTGVNLSALDMGWAAALGFCWQWQYAFFMFPLHVVINVVMLVTKQTKTLNVDMWNVANKVATGLLVTAVCDNLIVAFAIVTVQSVLELKLADANYNRIQSFTHAPGVTVTHPMFLFAILFWPIKKVLDKIIPETKKFDADTIRNKIGIFGDYGIIGMVIGTAIGLLGKYTFAAALTVGIQAATALTILPMVAKLFMTALAPISDAVSSFMQKKFPGKEFYMGIDWPILAGNSEIFVVGILTVPVILGLAIVLPYNIILPLGSIIFTGSAVVSMIIYKGDMLKMLITNIIYVPAALWAATYFAPIFNNLALTIGGADPLPGGQLLGWYGIDFGFIRWFVCEATLLNPIAIGCVILYAISAVFYFRDMKKENLALAQSTQKV